MESSRDKEIFDNNVLGSEEVQHRAYSSSLAAAAFGMHQIRSTNQDDLINDTDQPFKRVAVPVKILDDTNGEEIAELVLLRPPENRLNSVVLQPVFRVKILEPDEKADRRYTKTNGIESGFTSTESSSLNELSDDRRRPSRRRRVRINSPQSSTTIATQNESGGRAGERNRSRQRIVKARRRTHVKETPLVRSGEGILNAEENVRVQGDGRVFGRPDSIANKLEDVTSTPAYSAESLTTIRATTIRGNLPTSSKASNVSRGFYITRISDETFTPIPNALATIDSTKNPLTTSNDVIDDSTPRTDFETKSQETLEPRTRRINPTTEMSSTYESVSTTFDEVEMTRFVNKIDSSQDVLTSLSDDKHETVTPDYQSTVEDSFAITSTIMTTTEGEAIEKPSVTSFGPFTTEPPIDPTIPVESTTSEYSADSRTEAIDRFTEANEDYSTEYVAEALNKSENSRYGSPTSLEGKSSTDPTTSEENNVSFTTQTDVPVNKTPHLINQATPHVRASNRGRIRFTAKSKLGVNTESSVRDDPEGRAKSTESDDSTEVYDKKEEATARSVEEIGNRSQSRSRGRQRTTTKSILANDFRSDSVDPKDFTPRSGNSAEDYDKTLEFTVTNTETSDLSKISMETSGSSESYGSSSRITDQPQRTTKFVEADDIRINSVTPIDFTLTYDTSTDVYDKTLEAIITGTEASDASTRIVGINQGSYTSKWSTGMDDHLDKMTTSLETNDTVTTSVTLPSIAPTEDYNKNLELRTETEEADETTESILPASNRSQDPRMTSKSFVADDSTISSMTPNDLVATSTITTESYDSIVHQIKTTAENYRSSDFVEINEIPSHATSLLEDTEITTEAYDETTDSVERMTRGEFLTTREKVKTDASTNSEETTIDLATTTRSWIYNLQKDVTRTSVDDKIENADISSDVTLTHYDVTGSETFAPTTEDYVRNDSLVTSTMETGAANVQINEEQQTSTETIEGIKEEVEEESLKNVNYNSTEVTKQFYSTMSSGTTINDILESKIIDTDTAIENMESTTVSSSTITSYSKNNYYTKVTRRMNENNDNYSTADSDESLTSTTPREMKRVRGRVRFTNLSGDTNESRRNRRPVKQVVVRRRLANPSRNEQQVSAASEEKVGNSKRQEIEESESAKKVGDEELDEEKRNSTKSMRRRVVVYRGRPRAESVTSTTMQSSSVSSYDFSEEVGGTRRRKWRKRLVLKRAKTDDLDDQSIAETGHFHRMVIDDPGDEDFRPLGSDLDEPIGHQLVNFAGHEDEDIGDREVNIYKSQGGFLRRPGTLIRPDGFNKSRIVAPGSLLPITQAGGQPAPFSKIRPIDATEDTKTEDQSGRAQELAVTLADPPEIRATATTGRLPFRKTTRKISTTFAPRTEAPTTSRTTPISRRRQKPRGNNNNNVKIVESVSTRPRRPAIIDYDYYVDEEVRLVLKPELKDKLFVTRKGGIRCLDQGNFAHPTSCKKFITCARMVNGQVLGTEYTCPDKLSFDPVGGICNWSAGLGCEDNPTP